MGVTQSADALELLVYELASSELRSVAQDFPDREQFGIPTPLDLIWTEAGIMVRTVELESDDYVGVLRLYRTGSACRHVQPGPCRSP